MPGRRTGAVLALACGLALGSAGAASAADQIAADNSFGFTQPLYTMDQGEQPNFQNNEALVRHDVFSRGSIGGGPLFRSPTITGVSSALVNGTQYLNQGSYQFICSIHPFSMQATLQVSGDGTPVARPNIRVAILVGKLRRVRRTGRLPVRVRALTQSNGVALRLNLANRLVGRRTLNLAAGQVRRVVFRVRPPLRKRLARVKRARAVLVGTVRFGATRRAARPLR